MVHLKFSDLHGDLGKVCKKKEKYWHRGSNSNLPSAGSFLVDGYIDGCSVADS